MVLACVGVILLEIIAGAFLYMTYSMFSGLVAGQKFSMFSSNYFVRGVFYTIPAAIFLCPVFISFYLIRHKEIFGFPVFIYLLLNFSLFFFAFPAARNLEKISAFGAEENSTILSPGYFRSSADEKYVFYYSRVSDENVVSGICIDKETVGNSVFTFSNIKLSGDQNDFADPLIRSSVEMPPLLKKIVKFICDFVILALEKSSSVLSWICFSTVMLALMGVTGLRKISVWRLVNVLFIMTDFVLIFLLNLFLLSPETSSVLPPLPEKIKSNLPLNQFIVAGINVLLFVIFFIVSFVKYRAKKESGDSQFSGEVE